VLADKAIQQIDAVLAEHSDCVEKSKRGDFGDAVREHFLKIKTRLKAAIDRLSPRDSEYRKSAEEVLKGSTGKALIGGASAITLNSHQYQSKQLVAILEAMKSDYAAGYMRTIQEMIHADLFSDFLEMAEHLSAEGYKDPAAVLAGSVLEGHLRNLCEKNGLPVPDAGAKPLKADRLNANLKTADVYSTLDQKQVTAWLDLRNNAAHGNYDRYTQEQADLMISGIQNFIARNPA